MFKRQWSKAFTLIELLVVVAIIALLISILLPSLKRAKDQAKKAVCLSHLRSIGQAAHEYASEDERNMIMPLSPIMVRGHAQWFKRCVMWYSWGGRGATEEFQARSPQWINEGHVQPYYGTKQRPLTTYMYPDIEPGVWENDVYHPSDAPVFECPADVGYPDGLPQGVLDDVPPRNIELRMWDTVGNSYRGSLACLMPSYTVADAVATGIWGQRLDALQDTGQMIWGGDPLFYNFIGSDSGGGWPEVKAYGWHGEFMVDNQLFADGHADAVKAVNKDDPRWNPTAATAGDWGIPSAGNNLGAITRGPGYKLDCFPTPGVTFGASPPLQYYAPGWPVQGATRTPAPVDGW